MSQQKTCNACHISKDLGEFSPDPKGALGRRANCKKCRREKDARNAQLKKVSAEASSVDSPKATLVLVKSDSPSKKSKTSKAVAKSEPQLPGAKSTIKEKIVEVPVERVIEKYIEIPISELEIKRLVDERFQEEKRFRQQRQIQHTLEQKAQIRATKKLIDKYPREYERILEREKISLRYAESGMAALYDAGDAR